MGLSDMEELLGRIHNRAIVDYMREGLSCYHVGAYRGCIVLSYIALSMILTRNYNNLQKQIVQQEK